MSASVFVDTNVLLYARDASHPAKQACAYAWLAKLWPSRCGRLSFQVLQEYYVNATRKLQPGLSASQARQDVRNLLNWDPVATDAPLIEAAWTVMDRFGFSWWDAQIVAAARRTSCDILLSEDMRHGLDIDGMRIVNPFAADAPSPV